MYIYVHEKDLIMSKKMTENTISMLSVSNEKNTSINSSKKIISQVKEK